MQKIINALTLFRLHYFKNHKGTHKYKLYDTVGAPNVLIGDFKKMTVYNTRKNAIYDGDYTKENIDCLFTVLTRIEPLSDEEYNTAYRNDICDCAVGAERNIVVDYKNPIDVVDEFNRIYGEDYVIEHYQSKIHTEVHHEGGSCRRRLETLIVYKNDSCGHYNVVGRDSSTKYYNKACTACKKCLSERSLLHMKFETWVSDLEKEIALVSKGERDAKEVRTICQVTK